MCEHANNFRCSNMKTFEINEELADAPGNINDAPEGEGWFVQLELSNPDEKADLMTKEEYDAFCAAE